jgi:serine/threonine protein kinase
VAKWTDFGSLIPVREGAHVQIQNTPLYSAPEFLCNKKRDPTEIVALARPADVWSLGLVLLELLLAQPLSTILKERCVSAPHEWLAPAMCLLGSAPSVEWLKQYDSHRGTCTEEAQAHRRTRSTAGLAAAVGQKSSGLLDRLIWTKQSPFSSTQFDGFVGLIRGCLQWDPAKRLTLEEALEVPLLFSLPAKVCRIDRTVGETILNHKAQKRPEIRGLPKKTQVLTRQFANLILEKASVRPGTSDLEFGAVLIAAKLLCDPVVTELLDMGAGIGIPRPVVLEAERKLISKLHGKLT